MQHLSTHPIKVWLYQRLLALAARIQGIPAKVTPPPFRLLQIGSAFWQSRALYVATRLQVAEALGDTQKSTQELADTLGLHEDHLYRLLRLVGIHRHFPRNRAAHLYQFPSLALLARR